MTNSGKAAIVLRPYDPIDAAATLSIFVGAITQTAAGDYTAEQVDAWARPGERDLRTWNEAMVARESVVAVMGAEVVGFSDVDHAGHIDMLFVSPRHLRQGIASGLLRFIEQRARAAGAVELSSDVSITARPVFESVGFTIVRKQHPITGGVTMTNYRMAKALG